MRAKIRRIVETDNSSVRAVIESVMTSFACVGEGFSITDVELRDMYSAYSGDRAVFYVVVVDDVVLGTGGIGPLAGGAVNTCELKKMYFMPELRGHGYGTQLMGYCLADARRYGYNYCYLETVDRMTAANRLYLKYDFELLDGPMGGTGHSGCDRWYGLAL